MLLLWASSVWKLFHTLSANIKKKYFSEIKDEFIELCIKICESLPCKLCRNHAKEYMSKVDKELILTKNDLILLFFNFHNVVNVNKKVELYEIDKLKKYKYMKTKNVINNFIENVKMFFSNDILMKDFTNWIELNNAKFNKGKKKKLEK